MYVLIFYVFRSMNLMNYVGINVSINQEINWIVEQKHV